MPWEFLLGIRLHQVWSIRRLQKLYYATLLVVLLWELNLGAQEAEKGAQVWLVTVTLILLVTSTAGGLRLDMCFCSMEEL